MITITIDMDEVLKHHPAMTKEAYAELHARIAFGCDYGLNNMIAPEDHPAKIEIEVEVTDSTHLDDEGTYWVPIAIESGLATEILYFGVCVRWDDAEASLIKRDSFGQLFHYM